jgi:hypothetical protein
MRGSDCFSRHVCRGQVQAGETTVFTEREEPELGRSSHDENQPCLKGYTPDQTSRTAKVTFIISRIRILRSDTTRDPDSL